MRPEPLENDIPKHVGNKKKKKPTLANLTNQLEQLEKRYRRRTSSSYDSFFKSYYGDQIEAVKKQLEALKSEKDSHS